jgi:hypothetical protein
VTAALTIAAGIALVVVISSLGRPLESGTQPSPGLTAPPTAAGTETPPASISPSDSATGSPAAPPGASIPGSTPAPDATAPADRTLVEGVTIEEVFATLYAHGMVCESNPDGTPNNAGRFVLACQSASATGYQYIVTVPYWAPDAVVSVHVSAIPSATYDLVAFESLAIDLTDISVPANQPEAIPWVRAHTNDGACRERPCERTFGDVEFALQFGSEGARSISIDDETP